MHPRVHAQNQPDHPAIVMARTGQTTTYGELEAHANQFAHLFRSRGINRQDTIAVFVENHPRYFEIYWAAQRSGLHFVPVNSHLTAEEVAYIIDDSGAKAIFTSIAMAEVAKELPPLIPGAPIRFMMDGTIKGFDAVEEELAQQSETPIDDEFGGGPMYYSSGTTGRPKGIKRDLVNEDITTSTQLIMKTAERYKFDTTTRYLSPAPLYHAAPHAYNSITLVAGGTVYIMDRFDPEESLKYIEQFGITASQWVPTMFVRMLKMPEETRAKYDLSTHVTAIHAAAPCPVPVKKQMIDWWGPILKEYYAGSEGVGSTFITSEEWLKKPGSVGQAVLGELRIVDDDGNLKAAGEEGNVFFEGGGKFFYHNEPEKTAEAINEKGWGTLGDVGYVDEDGYLFLTDRKSFMIITGGVNVYPQETENLLITHPEVEDVAVVGIPHEEFGEEVKAVIQPVNWAEAGPELEAELIAFTREHLANVKCPRSVDFEKELPRLPTGKLYKRLLKDRYWGKTGTKIV
jgi:acyl-CoA synthetase (AMP-forming)/AMP-acid ligase II